MYVMYTFYKAEGISESYICKKVIYKYELNKVTKLYAQYMPSTF